MSTEQLGASVVELAELTLERQAQLEEEWLRLCMAFLTDIECNRSWSTARDLAARQPPRDRKDLLRFLLHPEYPFQFPSTSGFSGRLRGRLGYLFLRHAIFPVAQEVLRRGEHGRLTQMEQHSLEVEAAVGAPNQAINPLDPEGISDEALRYSLDFGSLDHSAPGPSEDADETLVGPRAPWLGMLARTEAFFVELKATQRFRSKRFSKELRTCHRRFRHLVEHAYPDMWSEGMATCRIHQGSRKATNLLAKFAAKRSPSTQETDWERVAKLLTSKLTELAGLAVPRKPPTERRRLQRVTRDLKRHGFA